MAPEPKPSDTNNDLIIYRLDELKADFKEFKKNYVTKEESHALKQEISELRLEIHEIKNRNSLMGWLYPTMSAAFSALFTYLIIEFFKSKN